MWSSGLPGGFADRLLMIKQVDDVMERLCLSIWDASIQVNLRSRTFVSPHFA